MLLGMLDLGEVLATREEVLPFCEEAQANHVDRLCGERELFGWPPIVLPVSAQTLNM